MNVIKQNTMDEQTGKQILGKAAEEGTIEAKKDIEQILNTIQETEKDGSWEIRGKKIENSIEGGTKLGSEIEKAICDLDPNKFSKNVIRIGIEIGKNIGCYAQGGTNFFLKIEKKDEENYCITSENMFEDKDGKREYLENLLSQINQNNVEVAPKTFMNINDAYLYKLEDGHFNDYSNAGLGYLDMARKSGKEAPFKATFTETKEKNLIQFNLEINIATKASKKKALQEEIVTTS